MSPPSSWSKNRPNRNQRERAGDKQGLFFDPEDGGDMFLQNVG
jgi:hypothetical protein